MSASLPTGASPSESAIQLAIELACASPCTKSKRGVVLFHRLQAYQTGGMIPRYIGGGGFNAPPGDQPCRRTESCRERCASYCVHAERRAIDNAKGVDLRDADMLHVKVVDGKLVPGGGPSCLPCANAVYDANIAGFWLYEVGDPPRWRRYTAYDFYDATVNNIGLWRSEP